MPVVRIIPERTIDAWTCSAILDREPRALVWAPTPQPQGRARRQPWHFPIASFDPPGKLLVLQNKALIARSNPHCFPKVSVDLAQLARLVDLEVAGLPVFYGLPGLWGEDLLSPFVQEDLSVPALLKLRPSFDRWQRLVRPLELCSLRPVMKAIVGDRRGVTLNTLSLVGFPPLRAFLSDTREGPWGRDLPTDPDDRTRSFLSELRPDCVVRDAVRRAASMGQAGPTVLRQRLLDFYDQPKGRAETADPRAEPISVDVQLSRTIWLLLPTLERDQDRHEASTREFAFIGSN